MSAEFITFENQKFSNLQKSKFFKVVDIMPSGKLHTHIHVIS